MDTENRSGKNTEENGGKAEEYVNTKRKKGMRKVVSDEAESWRELGNTLGGALNEGADKVIPGAKETFSEDAVSIDETKAAFLKTLVKHAALILLIISVLCAVSRCVWPAVVSGASMEDTYSAGDVVLADRSGTLPENGDIVLVSHDGSIIIKRVIASAGDVISSLDGSVYLNGEVLEETYVKGATGGIEEPVEVAEGEYFVMGDNREHSTDSRDFGCVSEEDVVGVVIQRTA